MKKVGGLILAWLIVLFGIYSIIIRLINKDYVSLFKILLFVIAAGIFAQCQKVYNKHMEKVKAIRIEQEEKDKASIDANIKL